MDFFFVGTSSRTSTLGFFFFGIFFSFVGTSDSILFCRYFVSISDFGNHLLCRYFRFDFELDFYFCRASSRTSTLDFYSFVGRFISCSILEFFLFVGYPLRTLTLEFFFL